MTVGIENNNPGNIRNDGTKWQGIAEDQSKGHGFVVFTEPKWGIRALAMNLNAYYSRLGLNTVRGIINRWAPPSENNTGAYVSAVADDMYVKADDVLDLHDYQTMYNLVTAIIKHENGAQPYDRATIDMGLSLAGIVVPQKPLVKSRTVQGASVAVGGGLATMAVNYVTSNPAVIGAIASPAAGVLSTVAQYAPWVLALLIVVGGGYAIWSKIDDKRKAAA